MIRDEQIDQLLKHYQKQLPELMPAWPPDIQQSARCIHTHLFEGRLSIDWMKKRCGINGKIFAARFRMHTGYSPKSYIIYHRVEAAKQCLVKCKSSITSIALSVGFHSLSSFDKTFKSETGMRPSVYRTNNRR